MQLFLIDINGYFLCLYSYQILFTSVVINMSKKISKKASAVRTISLAVGSLSLLVIAVSQFTDRDACSRSVHHIENPIWLS